jgi:hypothetical protein
VPALDDAEQIAEALSQWPDITWSALVAARGAQSVPLPRA